MAWNGSHTIYNRVIRPIALKYQDKIDTALDKASDAIHEGKVKGHEWPLFFGDSRVLPVYGCMYNSFWMSDVLYTVEIIDLFGLFVRLLSGPYIGSFVSRLTCEWSVRYYFWPMGMLIWCAHLNSGWWLMVSSTGKTVKEMLTHWFLWGLEEKMGINFWLGCIVDTCIWTCMGGWGTEFGDGLWGGCWRCWELGVWSRYLGGGESV